MERRAIISVLPQDIAASGYRALAMLCAVRASSNPARLLALHPRAQSLSVTTEHEGCPLVMLFWQELIDEERACVGSRGAGFIDPPGKGGAQYFQRRLRLIGWKKHWAAAVKRTPSVARPSVQTKPGGQR